MAQLTASDALKTFYRGPLQGQERYKMIAKKLKNEEPFKFFKKGALFVTLLASLVTMWTRRKRNVVAMKCYETILTLLIMPC